MDRIRPIDCYFAGATYGCEPVPMALDSAVFVRAGGYRGDDGPLLDYAEDVPAPIPADTILVVCEDCADCWDEREWIRGSGIAPLIVLGYNE